MVQYRLYFLSMVLPWSGGNSFAVSSRIPSRPFGGISPRSFVAVKSSASTNEQVQASSATASSTSQILADDPEFIKPERDGRQYRVIQLPWNGLQALLVHDPRTDAQAGSVHVRAGHFDDVLPGLAHFHEHMLFLGTHKYPSETEYESYLQQYGGYSNAYTDMEDTNYYFGMTGSSATALEGALDRLAQFFVQPTFEESMVERELRAIDSEYRNGKTSDAWRNYQLLKAAANPEHPFSKFGCGNYETLTQQQSPPTKAIQALKDFWDTYYQPYNLRLAVVGRANLDDLQAMVERTFGVLPPSRGDHPKVRHVQTRPNQFFVREHAQYQGIPAFGPEQLGKLRRVLPLLESRAVKILFATPPLDDPMLQRTKPHRVLSHLLGHESPGSLHARLNDLGFLTGLSAGVGVDTSDFSLFSLTLSLTPAGMQNLPQVLDLVFQWLALIRQTPHTVLEQYHEELRQISKTSFRFRENGDPTDFCSAAASLLFDDTPPAELLVAPSRADSYDPQITQALMDRLRPENALVTVLNSDWEDSDGEWLQEPWYGAKYQLEDIAPEQLKAWEAPAEIDDQLHVPALNQYIPTDFSLRCDDDGVNGESTGAATTKTPPTLLMERPDLRLWHKMDRYWRVPKSFIRLSLLSPNCYRSPRSMTLSRIFQRVLNDDLNSFVYDASLAGSHYRVVCTPTGYRVSVRGYSEKLPFLLDTLTSRMLSLIAELKEGKDAHPALFQRFEKEKQSLLRETKNYRLDPPHEIANYNARLLMEETVWYVDDYIQEMEGKYAERDPLTMEECAEVAEECLMGRVRAESLCIGNIDEKGAEKVADVIDSHFLQPSRPLRQVESPSFRSLKLPTKEEAANIFGPEVAERPNPIIVQEMAQSEKEENNCAEITMQVGSEHELGYEGLTILDLIAHISYNSAFGQLRTKEQLGYIVSTYARKTTGGAWGLTVVVQSSVALPEKLEERIEAWLKLFRQELEDMDPNDLAKEAKAVAAQLLERDTKLSQEVGRFWGEILNTERFTPPMKQPVFDRLEKLADELSRTGPPKTLLGTPRKTAEEMKQRVLEFFDEHFSADSPKRRSMSSRVYNHNARDVYEAKLGKPGVLATYADMRHYKQFLSSYPVVPYWYTESRR